MPSLLPLLLLLLLPAAYRTPAWVPAPMPFLTFLNDPSWQSSGRCWDEPKPRPQQLLKVRLSEGTFDRVYPDHPFHPRHGTTTACTLTLLLMKRQQEEEITCTENATIAVAYEVVALPLSEVVVVEDGAKVLLCPSGRTPSFSDDQPDTPLEVPVVVGQATAYSWKSPPCNLTCVVYPVGIRYRGCQGSDVTATANDLHLCPFAVGFSLIVLVFFGVFFVIHLLVALYTDMDDDVLFLPCHACPAKPVGGGGGGLSGQIKMPPAAIPAYRQTQTVKQARMILLISPSFVEKREGDMAEKRARQGLFIVDDEATREELVRHGIGVHPIMGEREVRLALPPAWILVRGGDGCHLICNEPTEPVFECHSAHFTRLPPVGWVRRVEDGAWGDVDEEPQVCMEPLTANDGVFRPASTYGDWLFYDKYPGVTFMCAPDKRPIGEIVVSHERVLVRPRRNEEAYHMNLEEIEYGVTSPPLSAEEYRPLDRAVLEKLEAYVRSRPRGGTEVASELAAARSGGWKGEIV